ncbi:MAG TPA: saccharopine dehydrogenase NADP-binding domain-containing protein [Candidatus Paceibacterota bacterium]
MKGLIFGAGNIGRGFLGLLLNHAGFEVSFIDTDESKIDAINTEGEYPVMIVSAGGVSEQVVRGVRAIQATNMESVEQAIVGADLVLTAVGKTALKYVAPTLARGLLLRLRERPRDLIHVAVVACFHPVGVPTDLGRVLRTNKQRFLTPLTL